jgi:hypothetical protein
VTLGMVVAVTAPRGIHLRYDDAARGSRLLPLPERHQSGSEPYLRSRSVRVVPSPPCLRRGPVPGQPRLSSSAISASSSGHLLLSADSAFDPTPPTRPQRPSPRDWSVSAETGSPCRSRRRTPRGASSLAERGRVNSEPLEVPEVVSIADTSPISHPPNAAKGATNPLQRFRPPEERQAPEGRGVPLTTLW